MPYISKLVKRLAVSWTIVVLGTACIDETLQNATEPETPVPGTATVASVRVLPDSVEVLAGVQTRVVAEPRDDRGRVLNQQRVVWSSSDTVIATVDSIGTVTARTDGYAEVTATVNSKTGTSRWWVRRPPVATVTVTPATAALVVGQTVALAAQPYGPQGGALSNRIVTWSSTATSVASVNASGVVTAVAAGTATIRATIEGVVGSSAMTVTVPAPGLPGTVSDVSVSATNDTTATIQFTEVTDGAGDAADYEVRYSLAPMTWASATPVARGSCTVSVMGTTVGATRTCVVRGLAPSTSYRFQMRGFRGTFGTNAVFGALSNVATGATNATSPAPVASVTLSPATASITTGQAATFAATVRDASGNVLTGNTITWSSTNTAVATVSSAGIATAVAVGTATIRGTTGGQTGSATLTVTATTPNPVATVTLSPTSDTVNVGQTVTYTPTLRDASGAVLTGRTIAWTSTNTAVATVSSAGVVTGVGAGTATVRATSEGQIGNATVRVVAAAVPVATVTVAPLNDTLNVGLTATFTATTRDAAGAVLTGRTVTWTSTNTTVATVTAAGVVTARVTGTATIRATSEGQIGNATLLVVAPPPAPVATVTVGPASTSAVVGGGAQFTVTLRDAGGNVLTGRTVTWTSTNIGVATVTSAGFAQTVAVGSATIRATSEGQTGSASLSVTAAPPPGGATVLWATSWAAGNRTDGGRLNQDLAWSSTILSVVPKSTVAGLPASWPANLLRITYAGRDAQLVAATGLWAAPVAGAKLCFRFLAYNALPNGSGVSSEHGMQSNIGDLHHFWQFFSPESNGSGWLGYGGSGTSGSDFASVPARRPMRVEECYTRTTGTRARVELRVTDESTGQVFTNVDFLSNWGGGSAQLVGREMTFSNEMDGFRSYYFGASGSSNGTGVSIYVTGFAVCSDWCGVYRAGEGN